MTAPKISVVLPLLVPTPFLRAMTEFAIKTLRLHADGPFELIVVEAEGNHFDSRKEWCRPRDIGPDGPAMYDEHYEDDPWMKIDKYLNFTPKIGGVRELNAAVDAASCNIVLFTGNDVIVPPGWDTEILRVFEDRSDAAGVSLSAFEPGAIVGPRTPIDHIVEGFYSPFFAFRRGWRFDEAYVKIYQDSDLVMRMYDAGKRVFRSCRKIVHHLNRMTSDRVNPEQHARDLARDERLFYQRWGKSPLAIFAMTRAGAYLYGREHESWTAPINLHYDPNKLEG